MSAASATVPDDFSQRLRRMRGRLGLTQKRLADELGVSFATVNRWENGQTRPSPLYWAQLERLATPQTAEGEEFEPAPEQLLLDFTAIPAVVSAVAEGERLSFGHLANPVFATEITEIDPLRLSDWRSLPRTS